MRLKTAIAKFYYDITLNELRRMHHSLILPNISYNSLLYLDLIDMTPDCTVSGLASVLHVSKSAVTMKVGELLRQGLVTKEQSDADKRVFYLRLNPEAVKEYRSYDQSLARATATVEGKYKPKEIASFCAILKDFCAAYAAEEENA
jgi:Transcriptional regulators